ncbi:MAG: hypothetical protein ACODAD_00060 [Planctomycetota bacterium]
MPIKVSCQCGKRLSVKDEYAGKRVKCPGCGRTLSIPQPQAAGDGEGISDLLDDVGVRAGVNRCPGCGVEIPEEAVLCVMCGFDLRRGHRIKTRVGSAMELEDDEFGDLPVHGVPLLDEAERRIAEDKLQQQNLSKGAPWWMLLLAFLGVVGFTVGMLMMPQEQVMRNGGIILIAAGGLLAFFFSIRLLIEAFKDSVLNGLLCLVVPLYVIYFVISRWDRVAGIFMFIILGNVLSGIGALMVVFLAPLFEAEEDQTVGLRAWQERPNAVSVLDTSAEIGIRQRASTNRHAPPARKQCPRDDTRCAKAVASYRVASNEHSWPAARTRAGTTPEQKPRKHG